MTRHNVLYKEAYNNCLELIGSKGVNNDLPSETMLGEQLGISRTTVRAVLEHLHDSGIIRWAGRAKTICRAPQKQDYYPLEETQSRAKQVEQSFMAFVLGGDLAPGTILRESELAREFGTSASAVREFLFRFAHYGLVEKEPNRHWVLRGFTRSYAMELFEVRETWELQALETMLKDGPSPDMLATLAHMRLDLESMKADIDERYLEFSRHDEAFHRLLVSQLNNRFVEDFFQIVTIIFHYHYRWNKSDERERNLVAIGDHLAIIHAIEAGDKAAARLAFRQHLASARRTLLASVRWEEEA